MPLYERTNAEKRGMAREILLSQPDLSDREIGRRAEVSYGLVSRLRRKLVNEGILPPISHRRMRSSDGSLVWVDTDLINRHRYERSPTAAMNVRFDHGAQTEAELEHQLMDYLARWHGEVARQMECPAGRMDLVADGVIYEVKLNFSREALFSAIGQAVIYRQAYYRQGYDYEARVIGGGCTQYIEDIATYALDCGIPTGLWSGTEIIYFPEWLYGALHPFGTPSSQRREGRRFRK